MICDGIFVWCVVIYKKMRVIYNHLVSHVRTNKIFEERALFLHLIDSGACGKFSCMEYLRRFCGAHYYIIENYVSIFFLQLLLM